MTTRTPTRTTFASRTVTTLLVTGMAALGLAMPAAGAATPHRSPLQTEVNAIEQTGAVGVIARSTGPQGQQTAAAGAADTATGEPAQAGDRFRIASTTKSFVATVVLQLVGEGRLSLDDTVEHRLPGVVSGNGNDGSRITVRQLLQHTSGIPNYTADLPELQSVANFQAGRFTAWTAPQLVALAMRHAPDFPPGTQWEYSNTNYILAGMIINKVTGHSWQQEVTRRIIRPLGLRDTLAPVDYPYIQGPHLNGYSNFGGSGPTTDVTDLDPSAADSAGAIISTTADLSRFYSALLGGRLLRPAQLAEMRTTVRAAALDAVWPGVSYGLGLMRIPLTCGGAYYSHAGDLPGYTTRDGVSADGRRVVVVETTGDGSAPDLTTMKAENALIDRQFCASTRK